MKAGDKDETAPSVDAFVTPRKITDQYVVEDPLANNGI